MDNTTTYRYLPTGMYLVTQSELFHQYCLVVVAVSPWNHIISDGVHQRFPIGGCHPTIYRINSPPTTCYSDKSLRHQHRIPFVVSWLTLPFLINITAMIGFCPSIMNISWTVQNIFSILPPIWDAQTGAFPSSYQVLSTTRKRVRSNWSTAYLFPGGNSFHLWRGFP